MPPNILLGRPKRLRVGELVEVSRGLFSENAMTKFKKFVLVIVWNVTYIFLLASESALGKRLDWITGRRSVRYAGSGSAGRSGLGSLPRLLRQSAVATRSRGSCSFLSLHRISTLPTLSLSLSLSALSLLVSSLHLWLSRFLPFFPPSRAFLPFPGLWRRSDGGSRCS